MISLKMSECVLQLTLSIFLNSGLASPLLAQNVTSLSIIAYNTQSNRGEPDACGTLCPTSFHLYFSLSLNSLSLVLGLVLVAVILGFLTVFTPLPLFSLLFTCFNLPSFIFPAEIIFPEPYSPCLCLHFSYYFLILLCFVVFPSFFPSISVILCFHFSSESQLGRTTLCLTACKNTCYWPPCWLQEFLHFAQSASSYLRNV